jgi:hypothetical protein
MKAVGEKRERGRGEREIAKFFLPLFAFYHLTQVFSSNSQEMLDQKAKEPPLSRWERVGVRPSILSC